MSWLLIITMLATINGVQNEMSVTTEYASRVECEQELENVQTTSVNLASFMNIKLEFSGECIVVHKQATLFRHIPAPGQSKTK